MHDEGDEQRHYDTQFHRKRDLIKRFTVRFLRVVPLENRDNYLPVLSLRLSDADMCVSENEC